jgi:WD40 repeat protein
LDGRILVSGGAYAEATIRLWDAVTGTEIGRLDGHQRWISALMFFPDGNTLASASGDGTIRLWDVAGRRSLRTFHGHEREVLRLALHPDNVTLISGGRDGTVRVWATGLPRETPGTHILPSRVFAWQFTHRQTIVTLERGGEVSEWKDNGFGGKQTLFKISTEVLDEESPTPALNYAARFSADGEKLAVGSFDGSVQVWDIAQKRLLRELKSRSPDVLPVAFLNGGAQLMVCERTHFRYREFELATGNEIATWDGPLPGSRFGAAVSPDEKTVAMIGLNGNGLVRTRQTGQMRVVNFPIRWAEAPRFSPEGKFLATGSQVASPKIWETQSWREIAELTGSAETNSVAFSPDGSRLAAGGSGGDGIRIWELESYQPLLTLPAEESLLRHVQFSPDGDVIGAVSVLGTLRLWRAPPLAEVEKRDMAARTP